MALLDRNDDALRESLVKLAREKPRYGYRRLHVLLRREAIEVNHKKVQRVYRELGITVKRRRRKRLERVLQPRPVLTSPNQGWSVDFASDVTAGSQRIRVLSVMDSFTKQSLALEVDTSFPSRRVMRVLDRTISKYGTPPAIRCDNVLTREGKVREKRRPLSIPYGTFRKTVTPSGFH